MIRWSVLKNKVVCLRLNVWVQYSFGAFVVLRTGTQSGVSHSVCPFVFTVLDKNEGNLLRNVFPVLTISHEVNFLHHATHKL